MSGNIGGQLIQLCLIRPTNLRVPGYVWCSMGIGTQDMNESRVQRDYYGALENLFWSIKGITHDRFVQNFCFQHTTLCPLGGTDQ